MRPVRLELKGFTAFREPQEIDFGELDLFAISGPTGSGKTSILDAITYALYGTIERVGKQASQFVSQGQPAMSVKFEFVVDGDRYLVARRTPTTGATKVMLERWNGDEWQQVGEGADRVTGANAIIKDALGLDYESFTRTVLLPQGKFAQFLSGDAKERRAILTELLGLELFERLGRRAGEMKRVAEADVQTKESVLASEYGGVTPEALAEASRLVDALTAREEAIARAETEVRELAERGADEERSVGELRSVAADAGRSASAAATVSDSLGELAGWLAEAERNAKEAAKELRSLERSAEKAAAALEKAEAEGGSSRDLERLRARAEGAEELRAQLDEAEADLEAARGGRPKLEKALASAEQLLAVASADAEAVLLDVGSAAEDLHAAEHADLAAALRADVRPGDDCPVCGREIERLPRTRRAPALEKAKAAVRTAESRRDKAERTLETAKTARDATQLEIERARTELDQLERSRSKRSKELATTTKELAAALGAKAAADPLAAVDERLERLGDLEAAAGDADDAVLRAKDDAVAAERERDVVVSGIAELRARLQGMPLASISERARSAGGTDLVVEDLPAVGGANDATALGAASAAVAERLSSLAERLLELAERRAKAASVILAEMHAATEGIVEPGETPSRHLDAVAAARAAATRELAGAEHRASELDRKLEHAKELAAEIELQRARLARFDALAKELRADRVISFLQAEALQLLAAAGSDRLATLSSERYRLAFEDDEFFVVDTWNGEERRSVRTLSGGETFLASLALALALSEQVRSLSVSEKARIDSLFLDEGFGTLDPESLEVVVDAIEQLGGDGRMVGVITHVQELAIRLPARIEVEKSPRGSRLSVVAAD